MRPFLLFPTALAIALVAGIPLDTARASAATDEFIRLAAAQGGEFGGKAARYLVEGMPEKDRDSLGTDFLLENLRLALKAREEFPWAQAVSEDVFLDDVLPYACLDEARDPWRAEMLEIARPLVAGCKTTTEAAQALNKGLWDTIKVHYSAGRRQPSLSPRESRASGQASCTGLSILLVDACRAVGVPARVAGIPLWTNKRGNHTWVEVWDGAWHFTGAGEYSAAGLDRGWFAGDAAKADASNPLHAIYATTWRKADRFFPLIWNFRNQSVAAVDVTTRYVSTEAPAAPAGSVVHFRLWDKEGGQRIEAPFRVLDENGNSLAAGTTKAGTADLNDMASVKAKNGQTVTLRFRLGQEWKQTTIKAGEGEVTQDCYGDKLEALPKNELAFEKWCELPGAEREKPASIEGLSREEAARIGRMLWERWKEWTGPEWKREVEAKAVTAAGQTMPWLERTFGQEPAGGRNLWISMHGGGGAPKQVNDQQWQNQIRLYQPAEGIVVAPRAPTDNWNLWHEAHIDDLFDRLIAAFIVVRGVNPDHVYLQGYSAGGDGVYQLGPRMADRFAAASMMAGHPNDASPLGLRNLPFALWAGANDSAYRRNEIVLEWGRKLDDLAAADPGGYVHRATAVPGMGHWMNLKDAESVPWMATFTRNPWPKKVVWNQSNRTHDRFYWLEVAAGTAKGGQLVTAEVAGQEIKIESKDVKSLTLRLSDALLDLDQPLKVSFNGKQVFEGKVKRSLAAMVRSLRERADPSSLAAAELTVTAE